MGHAEYNGGVNGVCQLLRECTSINMVILIASCFFTSVLQMADCGGMPQVDQVCMSIFV